ncbi:MAG: macro domain-containing protein [Acidimicrobiales bacterium]|nr:macro domain-containing protein [Actinomycetota bacterium]
MREIIGDLLDPAHGFGAIGHGVNLKGRMGAGIAATISARWPGILPPYVEACRSGELALGGFQRYEDPDGTVIYNLASQVQPGRDARLDAVESAVAAALVDCDERDAPTLALPQIGAGIGGLDWVEVRERLAAASIGHRCELVLVAYG